MTSKKQKPDEKPANDAVDTRIALVADFGRVYSILRTQPGCAPQIMAPVKAEMTLYERLGHFYKIMGKYDSETKTKEVKYNITATGYTHLNKVASISILTPQQLVVDGHPVPNPMIERDHKTKAITAVNIRKIGIGYSPAGNIVVVDKTLFYNVYTYLIQSIQKKMSAVEWKTAEGGRRVRTDKQENPDCAVYGVAGKKPEKAERTVGSWYFLPTEGELGIWINYESPAIIDCLEEHTQRQRFGDRIAQKIVERNILKDHPAIGTSQVFAQESASGARAVVTVYGYRNENTPRDLTDIVKQIEAGEETRDFEVKAGVVDVAAEEEKAELETVAGDEGESGQAPGALFEKEEK